ncbi:hypothetical protein GCM10008024_40550 [Allgaiera indica]|uniref:ATP-binding cassette, subfamily C, LapB n=2 Tax=Allgaiera indica TaxID=765699 RepID=A0AAN4UWP2_9RHOB|nr:hypothetical protein GCM10008024_40550 [Allgaiera indica]SDX90053.1 ATP-binding cassette, subfamily C, LapB [Allgaiera indica]
MTGITLPMKDPRAAGAADAQPDAAATSTAAVAADAAAETSRHIDHLSSAIDRLHRLLRRSAWRDCTESRFERLFCALGLLSRRNFTMKRLIAALQNRTAPVSADDVVQGMGNLGFRGGRIAGPVDTLATKRLPVLATAADGSAFVVFDHAGERYSIDGAGRIRRFRDDPPTADRLSLWSFSLDTETHPVSKAWRGHTGHSWFRAILTKFSKVGTALVLLSLALALAGVMLPLFTIQIYAQVISLGSLAPLPDLIAGMALVIALEIALLLYRVRVLAWIAARLDYLASVASFARILRIRPALSERAAVTDQAARVRSFESVRSFISGPLFGAILDVPGSLVSIAAIAIIGGWLALVPIAGVFAHLAFYVLLARQMRIASSVAAEETTEMQRLAIETFEKRQAIREAGLQHRWSDRVIRRARREQRAQFLQRMIGGLGESGSTFIMTATSMALLAFGTVLSWGGALGAGGLLAVTILGFRALAPYHVLCLSAQRITQLTNSVRQFNTLMDIPAEEEEKREYTELRRVEGAVSFLNTGFRGADTRPVFVGLEMEIVPGEIIGITGANGAGKTTLLKLIMGMADLSLGAVQIDGVDTRQLRFADLRARISYVPQYPKLFAGTLRENLLFADPLADDAKINKILRVVGLEDEIGALRGGIDHVIGDRPFGSSAFAFRFAFAQALMIDSRLILVDEIPNGVIDEGVGDLIRALVERARGERTVMFVSHRSDLLSMADRLVALRYGKIPVVNTPTTLIGRAA